MSIRKTNEITIKNGIGYCKMSNGKSFMFDAEDEKIIKKYYWFEDISGKGTAMIRAYTKPKERHEVSVVLGLPRGYTSGNLYDYRKSQMKVRTKTAIAYSGKYTPTITGVTGVLLTKKGQYRAHLTYRGVDFDLGTYKNKTDAIRARMVAEDIYCKDDVCAERMKLRKKYLKK